MSKYEVTTVGAQMERWDEVNGGVWSIMEANEARYTQNANAFGCER